MERLKPGLVYQERMVVEPGQAASLLMPGLPEVLATASLVSFLQLAAAKAVAPYLKAGQLTVGTKISLEQLASTPVGTEIRAIVRLERVEGRRLGFEVEACGKGPSDGQGEEMGFDADPPTGRPLDKVWA